MDLANAINSSFARWDRSHLSMFTLADGRVISDVETGAEIAGSIGGAIMAPIDITVAKVAKSVGAGSEFQFTFDFGDMWTHRCVVGEEKVDPMEVLGIRPEVPLPYWGWGGIPDQYGRRWAADDGEGRAPGKPSRPHPMLLGLWPAQMQVLGVDLPRLREAIAAGDADRFLAEVMGHDIDDELQQVGVGIPMALEQRRQKAEPVALQVINRLRWRGGDGDRLLADDLTCALRRVPLTGRMVPVDLEMVTSVLEGDPELSSGGYLDLYTGQVYDDGAADPLLVGDDAVIDVDGEPDRWLRLDTTGSRDGWQDMAAFTERQRDGALRERLERAIQGKGAFFRFRDIVRSENLLERWYAFSADRQIGRSREFLADNGIRVGGLAGRDR